MLLFLLCLWIGLGLAGSAVIFYWDLRTRLNHFPEVQVTVGELFLYAAFALLGPVWFYFAVKDVGLPKPIQDKVTSMQDKIDSFVEWFESISLFTVNRKDVGLDTEKDEE